MTAPTIRPPASPTGIALSGLYRALRLDERTGGALRVVVDARGRRRARAWREQRPFAAGGLLAQRLAAVGADARMHARLLSEPDAELSARQVAPRWLHTLAAACAETTAAGTVSIPPSVGARPEHGFLLAITPLLLRARAALAHGVAALAAAHDLALLRQDDLLDVLSEEMVHAALDRLCRTMVLELRVAALDDGLPGATEAERFGAFVARFRDPAARTALFTEYPVLGRALAEELERAVACRVELLTRLIEDAAEIERTLGAGIAGAAVAELHAAGDPHAGGRCVVIVRFRGGRRLVYKPRPLAADRHFQELLGWLNARGWGEAFRIARIVDRGTHGWMEFLASEPCATGDGLARFYRRIGGQLALLRALGATDMHFENAIAVGDQPMLIDLETLFHPALVGPSPDDGTAGAHREIARSVLSVGMLPERMGGAASVDVSALGARGEQQSPEAAPTWVASGTDAMRLERAPTVMPEGEHLPALRGDDTRFGFAAYTTDLLGGFTEMYRLLVAHRADLLADDGPIAAFAGDRIRVVLRPTRDYGALVRESAHPDLQRDALDRDRHFDHLWAAVPTHQQLARVVAHEHRELCAGDIPVFTTTPASTDLWSGTGARLRGFLAESGLSMVRARLADLGAADLERQLWLVRASLASALAGEAPSDTVAHALRAPRPWSGTTPLALARAVGDRLLADAVRTDGHASWIGELPTGDGGYLLRPLGADLYAGVSGVALFLAALARLTGEARFRELACEAATTVRSQLAANTGAVGIGGFVGQGGAVWTLAHLAELLGDPSHARAAEEVALRCAPDIATDTQLDVLSGTAGFLLGALAAHAVTGSPRLLAVARQCGDRLRATAQPAGDGIGWVVPGCGDAPLAGFSHGTAGIALALLRLCAATGDSVHRDTAEAALRYERGLFEVATRSWRDLRAGAIAEERHAWCHGTAGIGLARLAGLTVLGDAAEEREIEHAVTSTLHAGFACNHSLCHGALGNLELPYAAAARLQRRDFRDAAEAATREVLAALNAHGPLCGSLAGVETPGLMTGLAGVGYGLLRIAAPAEVPSVLVLAAPEVRP